MVSASSTSTDLKGGPGGKNNNNNSKSPHSHSHGDKCGGCFRDVEGQRHVPYEGKKYCLDCICDQCHDPLLGNFSVKNGKKYCDGCICFDCGTPLTNGFYEEGNLRFCDKCNHKHSEDLTKPNKNQSHDHESNDLKKPHSHDNKDLSGGKKLPPHSHDHSSHDLHLPPKGNNSKNGCKSCGKSVDGKPHKGGDRDKFCPPHENEYCCAHCDKELSGPVKDDGKGKRYHPDCYQKINKQSHGPCAACKKSIEDKPIEALDKKWHPDCFKCAGCKSNFPNGQFVEGNDGKPYCTNCGGGEDTNLTWGPKDKCGGCDKPLGGLVTHVMGHFWHQGCFKCYRCNTEKFITGYYPFEDKPYCEPCHNILTKPDKCVKCGDVLVGECLKTETGGMYHKKCFVCTTCNKGLTRDDAQPKFGKPYCKLCAPKASRTCVKCRKVISVSSEYAEVGGKSYCKSCAPSEQHVYGNDKKTGFTIDPRSGKKTFQN